VTIYCGRVHRLSDGVPLAHRCRVLDPRFLRAERANEYEVATAVLEAMPLVLHDGEGSSPAGS